MTNRTSENKNLYRLIAGGSIIGLAASFLQMLDKIAHLENPSANLVCNVNAVFNCSNVLDAWQSSFFGFPNSLMCIVFFTFLLGLGVAGLSGSVLNKYLRLVGQFFSVFFLGFGAWYLWQSVYVIGSLCIYCLICYGGVIVINGAWLRLNQADLVFAKATQKCIRANWDVVFWVVWAATIILAAAVHFYL